MASPTPVAEPASSAGPRNLVDVQIDPTKLRLVVSTALDQYVTLNAASATIRVHASEVGWMTKAGIIVP
jgi:hypothetical protein